MGFYSFSLLYLLFFSFKQHLSLASDTISQAQPLTGNQTITSRGGVFELGFFSPGNSKNYYIGIWYKRVSKQTVVWVANREKPLPDTSSLLQISQDGNLVLNNRSQIPTWSSNLTSKARNSTVAVLLDTGNLVLRDGSNSSDVIWQSFDHPTDTWLPGAKLGLNKITRENQILTSWRSSDDPSPGLFSVGIDSGTSTQYFLRWNQTKTYWTSGNWDGRIFSAVPEMTLNYIFNYSFVETDKVKYFTYSLYNTSILSRFVMDLSGQANQLTWLNDSQTWNLFWSQPKDPCDVYSVCGAFGCCDMRSKPFCTCLTGFIPSSPKDWDLSDWSGGCVRKTPLKCGKNGTVQDGFLNLPNMSLQIDQKPAVGGSAKECELTCLRNCSCSAYAYGTKGCWNWKGDLWNLKQMSAGDYKVKDLYLRLAESDLQASRGKKKRFIGLIIGVPIGVVVAILVNLMLICMYQRRGLFAVAKSVQGSLVTFSYRDLQVATDNFSEKMGRGSFGSVFKGELPNSTVVAVKKLQGIRQGEKQFQAEVNTLGTIQHVNLIRLHGFCSEGSKRLLVYEYMPNGSLDSHLFHKKSKDLDWEKRYQIVLGTARGLSFLHEKCSYCIMHCDIKPENVLLDSAFCPKVADFGLAKLLGREFSRVLTTMRGTRGYLAPEWISGLPITPKADVYSYGMMLFEVISGKRNVEQTGDRSISFFPNQAAQKLREGEVISLLDQRLEGHAEIEELNRVCRVACWCIQEDEACRPSMGQVVQILEGVTDIDMPPIPRTPHNLLENEGDVVFFSDCLSNESCKAHSNVSTNFQDRLASSTNSR